MQRKAFLKTSCSLCLLASAGFVLSTITSCAPYSIYKTTLKENQISVPISSFAKSSLLLVRAQEVEFDIALRKEKDGTYTALLLKCTHGENTLFSTGNSFECTLHGSKFDTHGDAIKGPAIHPLKKFKTQLTDDKIIIFIR